MRWSSLAVLAGLAATGSATTDDSGAVIDLVAPDAPNPSGCQQTYNGKFQIEVDDPSTKASVSGTEPPEQSLEKRQDSGPGALVLELKNSVLTDSQQRTGYIASNFQFQFDGPPQAGSIYTGGFCVLNNGSLVLGDSAVLYRCKSGNFYNLYDRNWAAQCGPVHIRVVPMSGGGGGSQNVGTRMQVKTIIDELADGQPQAHATTVPVPICQIGDGQIQAHTTPCAPASSAVNPITQLPDGQPQAPTLAPAPPETTGPQETAAPEPAPPASVPTESTPAPAPEPSSAVEPTPSSVPTLETSTRSTPTEAPEQPQPQAPSSEPTSSPVHAGAQTAMSGPTASLIMAVIGLFVFLY